MEPCHKIYFFEDIIYNILAYLDKNDSFNFINICKSVMKCKYYLYKKYVFNYNALTSINEFMHHIESIKSTQIIQFKELKFNNLIKLDFKLNNLDKPILDDDFKIMLSNLPKTLLSFSIEYYQFNLPLSELIKDQINLKVLNISSDVFDYPLDNLPLGLENLHINSSHFDQSLTKLPITLQNLYIFSNKFKYPLDCLPKNLQSINLICCNHNTILDFKYLPNLISLKINNESPSFTNFPENLTELQISNNYIDSFSQLGNFFKINLKILRLSSVNFNDSLNNLPKTLESLILDSIQFNQSLNNLPDLKLLVINGEMFDKSVNKLPETLIQLQISSGSFNKSLENLPKNLQILKIYSVEFNNKEKEICNLPINLQILILHCNNLRNYVFNPQISLKTIQINDYNSHVEYFNRYYNEFYNEDYLGDNALNYNDIRPDYIKWFDVDDFEFFFNYNKLVA